MDHEPLDVTEQPEAESAADPAPAPPPIPPPPNPLAAPRATPATTWIVTAGIIAALAVALIVTQLTESDPHFPTANQQSALTSAKTFAANVASYDYRHLHQDFTRVEQESTPSFRQSFIKSSDGLTKVLAQYKATATANVLSAGLVSIDASEAVVILFVDQKVSNTAQGAAPTTDNSRIKITLQRSNGRWLIDKLKVL
jgi:Mce-associated membrane protein